jgi:hypothetical protein
VVSATFSEVSSFGVYSRYQGLTFGKWCDNACSSIQETTMYGLLLPAIGGGSLIYATSLLDVIGDVSDADTVPDVAQQPVIVVRVSADAVVAGGSGHCEDVVAVLPVGVQEDAMLDAPVTRGGVWRWRRWRGWKYGGGIGDRWSSCTGRVMTKKPDGTFPWVGVGVVRARYIAKSKGFWVSVWGLQCPEERCLPAVAFQPEGVADLEAHSPKHVVAPVVTYPQEGTGEWCLCFRVVRKHGRCENLVGGGCGGVCVVLAKGGGDRQEERHSVHVEGVAEKVSTLGFVKTRGGSNSWQESHG